MAAALREATRLGHREAIEADGLQLFGYIHCVCSLCAVGAKMTYAATATAAGCFVRLPQSQLEVELARRLWTFSRKDGSQICWLIQLGPGGKIANYGNANETSWGFDGGDVVFRSEENTVTTRFSVAEYDGQKMVMAGDFYLSPDIPGLHRLISWPVYDPSLRPDASIAMRSDLDQNSKDLVIVFNGRGRCYDGVTTEFEMQSLGRRLQVDTVGFAERDTRCCWYADKADVVALRLAPVLARGYRRVVCTGMSSGGFAALLFARILSSAYPRTAFYSVSANAQTTLRQDYIDRVWASAPGPMLPPCIAPDARAACVPYLIDLPAFLASSAHPASHRLFVDSGNPADLLYASLLQGIPGARIDLHPLGMTHPEGCMRFFTSGLVQSAIEDALLAQ